MKKFILPFAFLLFLSFNLNAQEYYLNVSNQTYSDLSNPTSVNNGLTWDDPEFTIPIGFTFQFFDTEIETLYLDYSDNWLVSNIEYGENKALFSITGLDLADRAFDPDNDEGQPGGISPISYQVTGSPGNQIFKMEWKNAGMYDDIDENGSSSDYINFQLWLHEANGDIEYRFGENDLTELIAIYAQDGDDIYFESGFDPYYNETFGVSPEALGLEGDDPTAPELTQWSTIYDGLLGPVPAGTVYQFSTTLTSTNDIFVDSDQVKITPNPAIDFFKLETSLLKTDIGNIQIVDINGQLMKTTSSTRNMDISELKAGCYFVHLQTKEGLFIEKLIKL